MSQYETSQKLATEWGATLTLFASPDRVSENSLVYPLSQEAVIGRESNCQIVINSSQFTTVSRHHAKISYLTDQKQTFWQVCDLNSANGTYINEKRLLGCQRLLSGDRIMLSKDGPEVLFECQQTITPVSTSSSPVNSSNPNLQNQPLTAAELVTPSAEPIQPDVTESVSSPVFEVSLATQRSLWNLVNEYICVLLGHSDSVRAVAFSPDGQTLISGSADKTIKLWDLKTKEEICTLSGHKLAVNAVAFSPNGETVASGSADKNIKLWNRSMGEEMGVLSGHNMGVNAIAFSPDGQNLASGSADKTIKLWDLKTKEEIQTLCAHKLAVNAVAFSPDAQTLASGSADRTIKLWNLSAGEEVSTLLGSRSSVNAVVFSPDGQTLASGSDDKTIKLWNLSTTKEIYTLSGQTWQVGGVAISPNGRMFACGSEDKTIKIWQL